MRTFIVTSIIFNLGWWSSCLHDYLHRKWFEKRYGKKGGTE